MPTDNVQKEDFILNLIMKQNKLLPSRNYYFLSSGHLFIRFELPCNSLKDSLQKRIMTFMKVIIKLSVFDGYGGRYVVSNIHFRQDFFYINH